MESKEKKKNNFFLKLKDNKKILIIFTVVCVVVILLIGFFSSSKKDILNESSDYDYVILLEKRLSGVLSNVEGAGKVSVVIHVESGMETVLASKTTKTEINGRIETEETPLVVNGKTVVVKEMYPKINGVLIVCEGANNIYVNYKILQATSSLLDIDVDKIEILLMK